MEHIKDGDKVKIIPTGEIGEVTVASQSGVCYVKIDKTSKIKSVNQGDVEKLGDE